MKICCSAETEYSLGADLAYVIVLVGTQNTTKMSNFCLKILSLLYIDVHKKYNDFKRITDCSVDFSKSNYST